MGAGGLNGPAEQEEQNTKPIAMADVASVLAMDKVKVNIKASDIIGAEAGAEA